MEEIKNLLLVRRMGVAQQNNLQTAVLGRSVVGAVEAVLCAMPCG